MSRALQVDVLLRMLRRQVPFRGLVFLRRNFLVYINLVRIMKPQVRQCTLLFTDTVVVTPTDPYR